jgi:hypothetical protein
MAIWISDLCNCKSEFTINNGITTGTLLEHCSFHTNFEDTISDNRLKNTCINTINELINTENKEIASSFNYETGVITLTLIGFTEEELEIVYSLNLSVNIEIG